MTGKNKLMKSNNHALGDELLPPKELNEKGEARTIGIEIEYVGLTPDESSQFLQQLYSGTVERINDCEYRLNNSTLGQFKIEVDARLLKQLAAKSEENIQNNALNIERFLKSAVSTAFKDIIPVEIATPPVAIRKLEMLNPIVELKIRTHQNLRHLACILILKPHLYHQNVY